MATAFAALASCCVVRAAEPGIHQGGLRVRAVGPARAGVAGRRGGHRARHRGRAGLRRSRVAPAPGPQGRRVCDRGRRRGPGARRRVLAGRRRHGVAAAHLGDHVEAEARAADVGEPGRLGASHQRDAGAVARGPLPERDAAVSHPWVDGGPAGVVVCRRQRGVQRRGVRGRVLWLAARVPAHVVHGRADDAPGDPVARRRACGRDCRRAAFG